MCYNGFTMKIERWKVSLKTYMATEPPSGGFVINTGILSYDKL